MKNYEKPMVMVNDEVAEGVYAASGDCYTTSARIVQSPQEGRGTYVIQFDSVHAADDLHHSGGQVVELSFNQEVEYVWSAGTLQGSNRGTTIAIEYSYHSNENDKIGLGNVEVISEPGLTVSASTMSCNRNCGQH